MTSLADLRGPIRAAKYADEADLVNALLARYPLPEAGAVEADAAALVEQVRARRDEHTLLDTFLQEYGLSNDEGVALMCLAEALLRVPDADTMDALIRDKVLPANWTEHLGDSESLLVNASTWGLMLTGRVIAMDDDPADLVGRLVARLGEPVIRGAMLQAMQILGREFVLGRTIDEALERGADLEPGSLYSFDMLGEAARTTPVAERYFEVYREAVERVGAASRAVGPDASSGVSVKLSALHPRYVWAQRDRVLAELLPRLLKLCEGAATHGIALSIDAEEAHRLELSLDLFEHLCRSPALTGWDGLGIVVQAYGKRAGAVLDWVTTLAADTGRRIPVRLVKGAYWDAEIKEAQRAGFPDFPVFTCKPNTDLNYLVCAGALLRAGDRVFPQFATHNAHTLAAVMALAGSRRGFEFQRLHGMGELLYRAARERYDNFPGLRVYAPVGGHEDLLPYLVRRLLENGANSSFVNRFLDDEVPARDVVRDPAELIREAAAAADGNAPPHRHPRIRPPLALYAPERPNSPGLDLSDGPGEAGLRDGLAPYERRAFGATPDRRGTWLTVGNPANQGEVVGAVRVPDGPGIERAFAAARAAQPGWDRRGGAARADLLAAAADLLGERRFELLALLVREAGKTIDDALAEVREAEDFCRYYAARARDGFERPVTLPGPTGERNELSLHGRGVFVCISPWNFPLAIFLGQVSAALLAGNSVLAKPAEQTPLVAELAVRILHDAGVPEDVVQLVPGGADVGAALVRLPMDGVAFTGSTATARTINRSLAGRDGPIVPLIAETGGQNAMVVDSTALLDQVADDVVRSAFLSAGQRCSALRVLLLQEDIADRALTLIEGAMAELTIGDPWQLSTDIGPVIDADALGALQAHVAACRAAGCAIRTVRSQMPGAGTFFAPRIVEIEAVEFLEAEHFGPILHVVRFPAEALHEQLGRVEALGYGLTQGVHSRIQARVQEIFAGSRAGNTYVNRDMVGAVVGVQPFGGSGLSGTGPKAGGPHYLTRFAAERTLTVNTMAQGGNIELLRD